jgi:aspartyl-tRNA(Asn)/glutamyl-tRNA(Gln) amidotransferase subunit A
MALGALGTDTGGSIRIPASLTGVIGLKPTYGRVSLRGVVPLSWNLDHVGPLTRSVKDAALLLQALANYDAQDPTCIRMLTGDYLGHLEDNFKGRKFALAVGKYIEESDAEVLDAVRTAAKVFESLGATVEEVNTDWLGEAAYSNSVITQADGAVFHKERLEKQPDWFGEDVRQRLEIGSRFTVSEYALAMQKRAEVRRRCEQFFESYDVMLLPTTPITAPPIEGRNALEEARRLTRFTSPFNLAGVPALSIPCGFSKAGLPIGLQIVGPHWNEARVLRTAFAYEQATDWHDKLRPAI